MYEHKSDIINTRKGCLGGSDARLIQSIAELGSVSKSATKRLAICKGLIEAPQFSNPAMEFGNYVEAMVFENLRSQDARWQSNPCWVSTKYSREQVRVIDHPDFVLADNEGKVLTVVECKAVKLSFLQTRDEYKWQLAHHWLIANEIAPRGYRIKLMLCHYNTEGLDLSQPFEFDPSRLTVKTLRGIDKIARAYRIEEGINTINNFLADMTYYSEEDEIPSDLMPTNVQEQFAAITNVLKEIKEREKKVEDFKIMLRDFMLSKGIKAIRNPEWSVTLASASTAISVDYKKLFTEEIEAKRPRVARALKEKYKKVTSRSAYVTIKIKDSQI